MVLYLGPAGETTGTGQRYNLVVAGAFLIRVICPTDGVSAKELPDAGGGGYLYMVAKDPDAAVKIRKVFVTPLFILPLFVYISGCRREANESGNDGEQAAALDGINITRASFAAIQSLKENRGVEVE